MISVPAPRRAGPRPLPADVCLTDVWSALPRDQREAWIRVVAREARAVRIEAQQRRDAQHRAVRADEWRADADAEVEAGKRRCADLAAALADHKVGRPRARRSE